MNNHQMHLLLCTNGTENSLGALEYGAWLAGVLKAQATLLGVVEQSKMQKAVERALDNAGARLDTMGIRHDRRFLKGNVRDAIRQTAIPDKHLVVIGPLGRAWWQRWVLGHSIGHILKDVQAPVLFVPAAHPRLDHILVCMGGLGYASTAEHWAIHLAKHAHASLTILHVVEPVSYDYPTARQVRDHWQEILETDTPQGRYLQQALEAADQAGVAATFQVRHGDIIHEISAEISEGDYDLVAMGSNASSHSLRHFYRPDVTARIAEMAPVPVLIARFGQENSTNHARRT